MRALYGFTLASAGFRVKAVKDGFEALTELQLRYPDVIITDIAMPGIDGIQLIHIIKSKAELAEIPVIAITAYGKNLQRLAKSAGAVLAVDKPDQSKSLCDLVTSVLP
jgi:CheY-like chemotaxis protein